MIYSVCLSALQERLTEALRIGPEEYLGKEAREDDSDRHNGGWPVPG